MNFDKVNRFSDGLAAVQFHGRWGFINGQGKYVVDALYDDVDDFENGIASVRMGDKDAGKWGCIDKTGKVVVQIGYESGSFRSSDWSLANGLEFSEGLAAVRVGEGADARWGFIDKSGKYVINPQFEDAHQFREKKAAVLVEGKWGFISR